MKTTTADFLLSPSYNCCNAGLYSVAVVWICLLTNRVQEICVGILGNMACNSEACRQISDNKQLVLVFSFLCWWTWRELDKTMVAIVHSMWPVWSIYTTRKCLRVVFEKVVVSYEIRHHIGYLYSLQCSLLQPKCTCPAFLQSSDSVVEESLFFVFQPAIWHAHNVLVVRQFLSFHEYFQFSKKTKSLGARAVHLITRQLKHWLPSKMPALNYSVIRCIRHSCSYCTSLMCCKLDLYKCAAWPSAGVPNHLWF